MKYEHMWIKHTKKLFKSICHICEALLLDFLSYSTDLHASTLLMTIHKTSVNFPTSFFFKDVLAILCLCIWILHLKCKFLEKSFWKLYYLHWINTTVWEEWSFQKCGSSSPWTWYSTSLIWIFLLFLL